MADRGPGDRPGGGAGTVSRTDVGQEAGLSILGVADHLSVAPATASRLVDRAVGGDFVAKRPSPTDSRRAELSLTAAGEELRARSLSYRLGYLERVLSGWRASDVDAFTTLLERFAGTVQLDPPVHTLEQEQP